MATDIVQPVFQRLMTKRIGLTPAIFRGLQGKRGKKGLKKKGEKSIYSAEDLLVIA